MFVNHKEKKIKAFQWERATVCNFITFVLKGKADGWSVEFMDQGEVTVTTKNNK